MASLPNDETPTGTKAAGTIVNEHLSTPEAAESSQNANYSAPLSSQSPNGFEDNFAPVQPLSTDPKYPKLPTTVQPTATGQPSIDSTTPVTIPQPIISQPTSIQSKPRNPDSHSGPQERPFYTRRYSEDRRRNIETHECIACLECGLCLGCLIQALVHFW